MMTRKLTALTACALAAMAAALPAAAQQQHLQYFGYYANNGYVSANYNHTNITFVGVYVSDVSQATSNILAELATDKQYGIKAIVEVNPFLFTNTAPNLGCPYGTLSTSSTTFATFVNQLIADGYLVPNNPSASTVVAFYPADEPDNCGLGDVNGAANPALVNAINTIHGNANTTNFPIAAIFSSGYSRAAHGIQLFNWVGMDDYSLKDSAYISAFDQFESYVNLSTQRTILIPQAAEGGIVDNTPDTPSVMLSAAESDQSVILLMPFLWANPSTTGVSGLPTLLQEYTSIGLEIKDGTLPLTPTVPTDVRTVAVPQSAAWTYVYAEWNAVAGATYYQVENRGTGQINYSGTALQYFAYEIHYPGGVKELTYPAAVRACNADGCSAWVAVPGT